MLGVLEREADTPLGGQVCHHVAPTVGGVVDESATVESEHRPVSRRAQW
jgi:hypothetical protein